MKKLLSIALALALCLGLTVPALAAGKPGDTTIVEKGHTFTLSDSILYTFSRSDMDKIDRSSMDMIVEGEPYDADYFGPASKYLDQFYWPGIHTIYAVPEGTVITLSSDVVTSILFEMDVTWKNGNCHADVFEVGNFPGFSSVLLSGAGYILSVELEAVDGDASIGSGGASGSAIRDGVSDMISFYVPEDAAAANPFASSVPAPAGKPAFTDVAADAYYAGPVAWAVEKGITSGTTATTFSPGTTCTTAQILTFLWRAKGSPEPAGKASPFSDIKESDYYYKAALWAKENGLVSGTAFNGSAPCTRAATVTYLWKLAGSPSAAPASFTDVSSAAKYAQAVAWAVEKGVTSGTTATTFSPDQTCTRGQIVTFLYRAYQ